MSSVREFVERRLLGEITDDEFQRHQKKITGLINAHKTQLQHHRPSSPEGKKHIQRIGALTIRLDRMRKALNQSRPGAKKV
jgi:hypothetical protein